MAVKEHTCPPAFHIMTKPIGPVCNLDCTYCFYLEKAKLYPKQSRWKMSPEVLEEYVKGYIEAQEVPEVTFAWQGGEPTILGVDFFRRAVALQEQHAGGKTIHNAFQTNGTLLNDEWGAFLKENNFLVGISIDGPEELHDRYRVDKGGRPSFKRVMQGLRVLKRHAVEFNTLTVVQRHNADYPLEVYRFLREIGSGFIQFIPIVERFADSAPEEDLQLIAPAEEEARVSEWSVGSLQYGEFLSAIFDEWVRNDVGQVFVQLFDTALEAWCGMNPTLCVFSRTCGSGLALEHNGDLYSCDHYVYPEFKLGNIMDDDIGALAGSAQQRKFGEDKCDALPPYCQRCEVRFACNGECPKHRFLKTPEGDPGLSYLCAGYKHIFNHIGPYMEYMARELMANRPPANVMRYARVRDMQAAGRTRPERNDPCVCGSGRKFKKCCGRNA